MSAVTCRICGMLYSPSEPADVSYHKEIHDLYAGGVQPQKVRDFSKTFGWAVAHNDGGLERARNDFDPELGKLVVVFSWWSRALYNGVPQRDFNRFMEAHLAFADALVSGVNETAARAGIQKWERFAG